MPENVLDALRKMTGDQSDKVGQKIIFQGSFLSSPVFALRCYAIGISLFFVPIRLIALITNILLSVVVRGAIYRWCRVSVITRRVPVNLLHGHHHQNTAHIRS